MARLVVLVVLLLPGCRTAADVGFQILMTRVTPAEPRAEDIRRRDVEAEARYDKARRADALATRARKLYAEAVAATSRGRCGEVAPLLARVRAIDPGYDRKVPNDPELAACVWPQMRVDEATVQLARQMANAAARGDCDAAGILLRRIVARDPAYHDALTGSLAMGTCA